MPPILTSHTVLRFPNGAKNAVFLGTVPTYSKVLSRGNRRSWQGFWNEIYEKFGEPRIRENKGSILKECNAIHYYVFYRFL